jgi:tetratricopeptide (TPR) repeat protein
MTDPAPSPTVREDLQKLADKAEERLRGASLPRPLQRTAESVVNRIRRSKSYVEAHAAIEAAAADAAKLTELLARLEDDRAGQQRRRSFVEPFGTAWRDMVVTQIGREGAEATTTWLRRYAEAFVAGEFETCIWLSRTSNLLADRDLARRMLLSARAAAERNLAGSLSALERLTQPRLADVLPPEVFFSLWCMRGRAVARGLGDAARARDLVREALAEASRRGRAVPPEVLAALHATLGECLVASDDVEGATREAAQAIGQAPRKSAGYVLRGLIVESTGDFASADEWYEDAVEADGERAVAGELFAPAPPNLLWKYGRRIRDTNPTSAVRAIQEALRSGILGSGEYPERKAFVDLARAFERRREASADGAARAKYDAKAAEAYWEAGRRYAWVGDESSAVTYLSNACRLDPGNALYAFEWAEALRIRAVREDGTVDLLLLGQAANAWEQAYSLQVPGQDIPWAYTTMALIAHEESRDLYRPRASWRAMALLERGLLSDSGNVRTMAQLSQAHRLLGNRWTALALTSIARAWNADDELVFDQHLLALREVGQREQALELVDRRDLTRDRPWLVIRKVQLLVELRRPQEALALLESVPPSDPALYDLQLGLCYELVGQEEAAQTAYERVYNLSKEPARQGRGDLSAWAGYILGRYDEAEKIYSALVRDDPEDASLWCDFGQILLARGDPARDDVGRGRRLLLEGVGATRSVCALRLLERIDLPRLLGRVAGRRHEADVQRAVEEIATALRDRQRQLELATAAAEELEGVASTDSDPTARQGAMLGLARLDMASDVERALERYVALAADGLPEAVYGVSAAGWWLRRAADELARSDDPAAALDAYQELLTLLERLPSPPVELTASTNLQAALSALELDQEAEFAEHAVRAFAPDLPYSALPALREALSDLFVRPALYWNVTDAARNLRDRKGAGDATVAAAERLLSALDPSALLRSGRDDVEAAQVLPLATPLAVQLGPGLLDADERPSSTLLSALQRMRDQVGRETGVQIPGVDLQPLEPGAHVGSYAVELYEDRIAEGTVPVDGYFMLDGAAPDGPERRQAAAVEAATTSVDPVTGRPGRWITAGPAQPVDPARMWSAERFVIRHLEAVIRTYLPRLFSIDDVAIWLSSVPTASGASLDIDRLSRWDRLELLRLLRLLLREQVPILDVKQILHAVRTAAPDWTALDLLPAVRRRLRSRLAPPAILESPATPLPHDLEAALAAGRSSPHQTTWELPRADASAVTERVLAWYRARTGDGPVVVRDPGLRPFLWRLMVELVPGPVWVLSEEEAYGVE